MENQVSKSLESQGRRPSLETIRWHTDKYLIKIMAVLQYTSQYSFVWDFGGMAIMDLKWVGWIPLVTIPNPDQPILVVFSVPKWKVQNHLEFLFKDVFKNDVLNHFLF